MSRCAIYVRVSTDEQNINNQCDTLIKWSYNFSDTTPIIYQDVMSGGAANRPQFRRMLSDAKKHFFDVLLIWSLDRFSREGVINTRSYIQRLKHYGVDIVSYTEPIIDTRASYQGDVMHDMIYEIMLTVYASLAQLELKHISDRTKVGIKGNPNVGKRGKDKKPRKKRVSKK